MGYASYFEDIREAVHDGLASVASEIQDLEDNAPDAVISPNATAALDRLCAIRDLWIGLSKHIESLAALATTPKLDMALECTQLRKKVEEQADIERALRDQLKACRALTGGRQREREELYAESAQFRQENLNLRGALTELERALGRERKAHVQTSAELADLRELVREDPALQEGMIGPYSRDEDLRKHKPGEVRMRRPQRK
jgi:hypothetical protein